jgi:outer membrane protein assembly factor BamB
LLAIGSTAGARVPPGLIAAAAALGTGGGPPAPVSVLAEGEIRAMFLSKLTPAAAGTVVLLALAALLWPAAGPAAAPLWAATPTPARASAPVPKEGTTPYVKWAVNADPASNGMHDPLVVKDLVVVGTDRGELRAYKTGTGEEAWTYQHGKRIFHRPATDGTRVFFTAEGGPTAVTADTGNKLWAFDLDRGDGPIVALPEKGLVFAASHDGTLYALDAKTGAKKWDADFAADAPPDPPGFAGDRARFPNTKARPSALVCDGETVYLSVFDQCRLVAFAAATGKRLWAFQTGGWIFGAAVATPTHVFVGSQDKCFYGLDKKTGKQAWKFETKGRVESGGAVDDKYVYFGSCDGSVYCLIQSDGKERWHFDTDWQVGGGRSAIYSVPVLRQGAVHIAAGEGQFYALAAETGALRWKLRAEAQSDLFCSPATDGRSYFVTTRPGTRPPGAEADVSSLVAISLK